MGGIPGGHSFWTSRALCLQLSSDGIAWSSLKGQWTGWSTSAGDVAEWNVLQCSYLLQKWECSTFSCVGCRWAEIVSSFLHWVYLVCFASWVNSFIAFVIYFFLLLSQIACACTSVTNKDVKWRDQLFILIPFSFPPFLSTPAGVNIQNIQKYSNIWSRTKKLQGWCV